MTSILAKVTIVTAALLFCTTRLNVLAHTESRVLGTASSNHLVNSSETERRKSKLPAASFVDANDRVQHDNIADNIVQLDILAKSLPENRYVSNNHERRVQRRGEYGYDAYGVPPSTNTASAITNNDNNDTTNNGSGWFGKKQRNDDTGANSGNAYSGGSDIYGSSYYASSNSAASPSSSNGAYGSYGAAGAGSTSSTSGYGSYGSSSSTSAYGSPRSSSYYSGSSYSSTWGAGSASSPSTSHQWGSSASGGLRGGKGLHPVKIDLLKALFFLLIISSTGMLLTAHSMEHHPEGTLAICCRVSLHTVNCVYSIIYNLYHCRLGEIPGIICGGSELEEDEYTEEELERMTLRPGIEGALDREHRKALRKVGVEMNMIKPKNGSGGRKANGGTAKSNGVQNGATIAR